MQEKGIGTKSQQALKQHNCVGKMDYDKRMADKKSFICFVRRKDNPKKSFITAEVDCRTLKVKQFYGAHNKVAPEEMEQWKKAWEKHMKNKQKKELARKKAA